MDEVLVVSPAVETGPLLPQLLRHRLAQGRSSLGRSGLGAVQW